MENQAKLTSQIRFDLGINLFDAYVTAAHGFCKAQTANEARKCMRFAKNSLDDLDAQHPRVIYRRAVYKRLKGNVSMLEGQLEKAAGKFKEAIIIAKTLLSDEERAANMQIVIRGASQTLAQIADQLPIKGDEEMMLQIDDGSSNVLRTSSATLVALFSSSPSSSPPPTLTPPPSPPPTSRDIPTKVMALSPQPSTSRGISTSVTDPTPPHPPPKKKAKTVASAPRAPPKGKPGPKTDKPKSFVCPWENCDKAYAQKCHLTRHIETAHKGVSIACERGCGRLFSTRQNMETHVRITHEQIKIPCDICGQMFSAQCHLDDHVKRVHNNQHDKYQCNVCHKDFSRARYLRIHYVVQHAGELNYKCSTCGSTFGYSQSLKDHLRTVHDKTEKYSCQVCDTKFVYRSTFVKHTKARVCLICLEDFKCSTQFTEHRRSHSFKCILCDRMNCNFGPSHAHASGTHVKRFPCLISGCQSLFTMKSSMPHHLTSIHGMTKCHACPECFENEATMLIHCKQTHAMFHCALCLTDEPFESFDVKDLSRHIASKHSSIFHCSSCGGIFGSCDIMASHQCSNRFSKSDLELINFLRQPIDVDALAESLLDSVFTDEDGKIAELFPCLPCQGVCSIDKALNVGSKLQFRSYSPPYLNQDQRLFQCGSSAILSWCLDVNTLSWCYEMIVWDRSESGVLLPKPHFNRSNIHFKRDSNDTIFNVRSSVLEPPYHMGHARAAENCWNLIDFKASFSNLNYYPMHERLNTGHWRSLEDHIRRKAKQFSRVFVATGAILSKHGQIVSKYVRGVYCPPAFYAAFEDFDNKLHLFCWVMRNDASNESVEGSEVSLVLLEKLTKTRFLVPDVLNRVTAESIKRHTKELRRHDEILGVH